MKKIRINIFLGVFLTAFNFAAFAQTDGYNCIRKNQCNFDLNEDFDYRVQSQFGMAYPGDTIVIKTAVYANKKYNIAVCADPELGEPYWKVVIPKRVTKKEFIKYIIDSNITYKIKSENLNIEDEDEIQDLIDHDEYYVMDDEGEAVVEKVEVEVIDTIYKTVRKVVEKVVFDSQKGSNYEASFKQTTRLFIYIYFPTSGDEQNGGCYNAYIGRKSMASRRTFRR